VRILRKYFEHTEKGFVPLCVALLLLTLFWYLCSTPTFAFLTKKLSINNVSAETGYAYIGSLDDKTLTSKGGTFHAALSECADASVVKELQWLIGETRVYAYLEQAFLRRFPRVTTIQCKLSDQGNKLHAEIRQHGTGYFSVWEGQVYFSSLDNTDPRWNGKQYHLLLPTKARSRVLKASRTLSLLLGAHLFLAIFYRHVLPGLAHLWQRNSVFRNVAPGFVISLAVLFIAFGIAEVALRLKSPFTKPEWPSKFDPRLGHIFEPGATLRWTNNIDFWTSSKINSLGFPDREPVSPKPAGTFRILVLGDSFVEAAQVRIEEKFHVLLEALLNKSFSPRRFDTVALGYSGTGQANQLPFYEVVGTQLQPDLVILLFVANDFANNSVLLESVRHGISPDHPFRVFFERNPTMGKFERLSIDPDWNAHTLPVRAATESETYRLRIAFLRGLSQNYDKALSGWNYPNDFDFDAMFYAEDLPRAFVDALEATEHVLGLYSRLAKRDQFKLLIVAAENVTEMGSGSGTRGYSKRGQMKKLMEMANRLSIPVLDLYPEFVKLGDLAQAHFRYDSHWSPTGHNWAATAIAKYLEKNPALLANRSAQSR
jgi:lysophospholipase L1-like esterase